MKIKLSPSMKKCIKEIQEEALKMIPLIAFADSRKIVKKPTKKKVFLFEIINFGLPKIKLYINKRFYKIYVYKDKIWQELEK